MATFELPALYADTITAAVASGRPVLVNRDPGPDEAGVPLDWPIALDLVDPGLDGIDRAHTMIWVDGALAFDGSSVPELQAGFDGPRAMIHETSDTLRIVLDPASPFDSQAEVEVRVVSRTNGGLHTLDEAYVFTAEDRTAPRLVAAQATGQLEVLLSFDEPIRVSNPTGFAFAAKGTPAVKVAAVDALSDGSLVTVRLDTEMTPDVLYAVSATGVVDLNDNPVSPPGDSALFAGFRPARPSARLFDLWSMLPIHNRRSDTTGDLWRFIACLQEVTDLLLAEVDRFADIFDLERAPEAFLDLILQDLGNPFPFELDEASKRRLAAVLVEMYRQKGTAIGIKNAIRFFLDIDITAITAFIGTTLVLGESELGVDWELGPSDRFARYAFDVEVDRVLTETERTQIRAIVNFLKPGHTHFVNLLEPTTPPVFEHWELGLSELGVETELH